MCVQTHLIIFYFYNSHNIKKIHKKQREKNNNLEITSNQKKLGCQYTSRE